MATVIIRVGAGGAVALADAVDVAAIWVVIVVVVAVTVTVAIDILGLDRFDRRQGCECTNLVKLLECHGIIWQ